MRHKKNKKNLSRVTRFCGEKKKNILWDSLKKHLYFLLNYEIITDIIYVFTIHIFLFILFFFLIFLNASNLKIYQLFARYFSYFASFFLLNFFPSKDFHHPNKTYYNWSKSILLRLSFFFFPQSFSSSEKNIIVDPHLFMNSTYAVWLQKSPTLFGVANKTTFWVTRQRVPGVSFNRPPRHFPFSFHRWVPKVQWNGPSSPPKVPSLPRCLISLPHSPSLLQNHLLTATQIHSHRLRTRRC